MKTTVVLLLVTLATATVRDRACDIDREGRHRRHKNNLVGGCMALSGDGLATYWS